jgi:hypothetical protein
LITGIIISRIAIIVAWSVMKRHGRMPEPHCTECI